MSLLVPMAAAYMLRPEVACAQNISFKDTIAAYNHHRSNLNKTGMHVLGAWGLGNVGAGAAMYFASRQDETKYFGEMTALWGAVNTGIAGFSLLAMRAELHQQPNAQQAYSLYRSNKKMFLINSGLDVVYIGAGLGLTAYSKNKGRDEAMYSGFGKSVVVQGVFLLLFDYVMFSAHQMDNSKWFRIMNEIQFTNSSVGINHTF
jgi:hypothetical protein